MIHVEFWVARLLRSPIGSVTTTIEGISTVVILDIAPRLMDETDPAAPREIRPAGALVRVAADVPTAAGDDALAAHALRVALAGANRVLHVAAFVGGRQGPVHVVAHRDIRDPRCWYADGADRRDLPLPTAEAHRPHLREAGRADVQRVLDHARGPHRADAEALWLDAVEAHYDGRYREAVVVARAAVEVAWKSYASAAATVYQSCTTSPARREVFADYVERSLKWPLPERLDSACEILLGFSFRTGWPEERWTKLCQMSDVRHATAHAGARPAVESSWTAIELTRAVLDELNAQAHAAGVA